MEIDINFIKYKFPILEEPALLAEILAHGTFREMEEGAELIRVGQYIKGIPLVISGLIKISREDDKGNEIFLYYLEGGNTCAMSLTCCMEEGKSNIRAVAEEETEIIAIPVGLMNEWIGTYPSWRKFTMLAYAQRFEELLNTIDSITFSDMEGRLVRYLKEKSKALRSNEFHVTHQQIAYDLNSSREAVSRLLKKMETKKLIKLSRNKIELLHT